MTWCVHHEWDGLRHVCTAGHCIDQRFRYGLRYRVPCTPDTVGFIEKSRCSDAKFTSPYEDDILQRIREASEKKRNGKT